MARGLTGVYSLPPGYQAPGGRAAYFDVDGTIMDTTIVTPLIWLKRKEFSLKNLFWLASLPIRGPYWLVLDYFSREASNRSIYRNYDGMLSSDIRMLTGECFKECLLPRLFPEALDRINALKRDNFRIVLVTGGLDFWMKPLAAYLDAELVAPTLFESHGRFTGIVSPKPLIGMSKAAAIKAHASRHSIPLEECFAYGDSETDLPMLECVGHPIAVNADGRLEKVAHRMCWKREEWARAR